MQAPDLSKYVRGHRPKDCFADAQRVRSVLVSLGMLPRLLATVALLTVLTQVASAQSRRAPAEYEFNVEGGIDLRNRYELLYIGAIPDQRFVAIFDGAQQRIPAPYVGLSAMRRIPGLRAFYGLRVDGHRGVLYRSSPIDDLPQPGVMIERPNITTTAMLNYRAFIFDMQGDCDCPTWGDDSWFKKAFFAELGVGGGYHHVPAQLSNEENLNAFGFAYMVRLGVSHRFTKQLEMYLAAGGHGLIAERGPFRKNDVSLRPTLGFTYRPRR